MALVSLEEIFRMVLYVDGGCSENGQLDQTKRRMVAVVTDDQGTVLHEYQQAGGSNNIAEFMALRDALVWARLHCADAQPVEIRTDSRNNLAWVASRKLGKKLNDRATVETLQREIRESVRWLEQFVTVALTWVPRDENLAGHVIEERYGL